MSYNSWKHEPVYFMPTRNCCVTSYWKSSPSPPPAPDYAAAANATAAGNLDVAKYTTQANRANQVTPWGSLNWTNDGNNNWTQTTNLTPLSQDALNDQLSVSSGRSDAANTLLNRVKGSLSDPIDYSSAGNIIDAQQYNPDDAVKFGQAAYDQQKSMLDPQYQQQEDSMRNNLALQGLSNTSEAYGKDMSNFYRAKDDAYGNLAKQSLLTGQQVAQNNYQTALQGVNAQNNIHSGKMTDLVAKYNTPINQLNSLLTGSQVSQPQFASYAAQNQVAGPDLLGAAQMQGQYDMNAYNGAASGAAGANAGMGSAVGSIASAALMAF